MQVRARIGKETDILTLGIESYLLRCYLDPPTDITVSPSTGAEFGAPVLQFLFGSSDPRAQRPPAASGALGCASLARSLKTLTARSKGSTTETAEPANRDVFRCGLTGPEEPEAQNGPTLGPFLLFGINMHSPIGSCDMVMYKALRSLTASLMDGSRVTTEQTHMSRMDSTGTF